MYFFPLFLYAAVKNNVEALHKIHICLLTGCLGLADYAVSAMFQYSAICIVILDYTLKYTNKSWYVLSFIFVQPNQSSLPIGTF